MELTLQIVYENLLFHHPRSHIVMGHALNMDCTVTSDVSEPYVSGQQFRIPVTQHLPVSWLHL